MVRRIAVCALLCASLHASLSARQAQQAPTRRATIRYAGTDHAEIRIALDLAGVADPKFRNRLNPLYIDPAQAATTSILFQNRAADRTMRVVLPGRPLFDPALQNITDAQAWTTAKKEFEDRIGVKLDKCAAPPRDAKPVCDLLLTIPPLNPQFLPLAPLVPGATIPADSPLRKAVKFTVSFFDDAQDPAYPNGYFMFVEPKDLVEQDSQTVLTAAGQFAGKLEPALARDGAGKPSVTIDAPYTGGINRHYTANARVVIHQSLGDRADADVDVTYKNGDFGEKQKDTAGALKDVPGTLTAGKYQFNLYARTGMVFSVGRFDLAVPSSKIALNESGEALRLNVLGNYSVSELLKRESVDGVVNAQNQDDRAWLFQGESITIKGVDFATFTVAALFGKDHGVATEHGYRTAGGELFFTTPHRRQSNEVHGRVRFRGSAAYYASHRSADAASLVTPGHGNVELVTGTWAFLGAPDLGGKKQEVLRSVTALFGIGSGDKANTTENESYLGENPAFAPDAVFLSTLAKAGRTPAGPLPPGLANKRYFSLVYTEQHWSPLALLATAKWPFGALASDIISKSTIVRFHHYTFREPVFDEKNAGNELDIEMLLESPRGIKPDILVGRYYPGKATKPLFGGNPWLVSLGLSIKIGG